MRAYLESPTLQSAVGAFFAAGKPIGAICHGVLLAARSKRPDGRSVLHGRITTALTWALERKAHVIARRTRFWDPTYYRTYAEAEGQPEGFMSVQQEVTRALARPADFRDVPARDPNRKRRLSGTARDTPTDDTPAFVVRDGNYVSARWPGDAFTFAKTFHDVLTEAAQPKPKLAALIFDVDGTLAETEELHRAAFNAAFQAANLPWHWDVPLYAQLLKVTGGKERIAHYLTTLPDPPALDTEAIAALHRDKTARYAELVEAGGLSLRPGVAALVAEARNGRPPPRHRHHHQPPERRSPAQPHLRRRPLRHHRRRRRSPEEKACARRVSQSARRPRPSCFLLHCAGRHRTGPRQRPRGGPALRGYEKHLRGKRKVSWRYQGDR